MTTAVRNQILHGKESFGSINQLTDYNILKEAVTIAVFQGHGFQMLDVVHMSM
jgi:hypothetical protein